MTYESPLAREWRSRRGEKIGTIQSRLVVCERQLTPAEGKALLEMANEAFCHTCELARRHVLVGLVTEFARAIPPSGPASKLAQAADPVKISQTHPEFIQLAIKLT